MYFVVRTKKNILVNEAVTRFNNRMTREVKTPFFDGEAVVRSYSDQYLVVFNLEVLFPPFFLIFFFVLGGAVLLGAVGWWITPFVLLCLSGLLWTKFFYAWLFKLSLRKIGYKDLVRLL